MRTAVLSLALLASCAQTSWYAATYRADSQDPALGVEVHEVHYWVTRQGGQVVDAQREPLRLTLSSRVAHPLLLDWNRSAYLDDAGQSFLVVPASAPAREWELGREPSPLAPGASLDVLVVPSAGRIGGAALLPTDARVQAGRHRLVLAQAGGGEAIVVPVTLERVEPRVVNVAWASPAPDTARRRMPMTHH